MAGFRLWWSCLHPYLLPSSCFSSHSYYQKMLFSAWQPVGCTVQHPEMGLWLTQVTSLAQVTFELNCVFHVQFLQILHEDGINITERTVKGAWWVGRAVLRLGRGTESSELVLFWTWWAIVIVCFCVFVWIWVFVCVGVQPQAQGSVDPAFPFALTHKCWDYLGDCFLRMP